jgi:hypothetical protein
MCNEKTHSFVHRRYTECALSCNRQWMIYSRVRPRCSTLTLIETLSMYLPCNRVFEYELTHIRNRTGCGSSQGGASADAVARASNEVDEQRCVARLPCHSSRPMAIPRPRPTHAYIRVELGWMKLCGFSLSLAICEYRPIILVRIDNTYRVRYRLGNLCQPTAL